MFQFDGHIGIDTVIVVLTVLATAWRGLVKLQFTTNHLEDNSKDFNIKLAEIHRHIGGLDDKVANMLEFRVKNSDMLQTLFSQHKDLGERLTKVEVDLLSVLSKIEEFVRKCEPPTPKVQKPLKGSTRVQA